MNSFISAISRCLKGGSWLRESHIKVPRFYQDKGDRVIKFSFYL
ncbi:hypothetical protein [Nostoc spongiaeforme]|nr:hypothetical protein [Nostoc spongiaeforme]